MLSTQPTSQIPVAATCRPQAQKRWLLGAALVALSACTVRPDAEVAGDIAAQQAAHVVKAREDAETLRRLAVRMLRGDGIAASPTDAVRLLKVAAEHGHAGAQHDLALCYARGEGVARDREIALRWLERASDQGLRAAQTRLEVARRGSALPGLAAP
jgi:TPR repeat protein